MNADGTLQRRLQYMVACQVALGSCLLGMGQGDPLLPLATIVAAGAAVYFTDIKGWLHLPRLIANLAAVAAVGFSSVDFFYFRKDVQLLAVANLLVYLEVILLFQRKSPRLNWQLIVLSLLQVVVGSAINLSVLFGLVLVVYLALALTAFHLLFVFNETLRCEDVAANESRSKTPGKRAAIAGDRPAARIESGRLPTPVRHRPAGLNTLWSGRALRRHVAAWTVAALVVTGIVFAATPRIARSGLHSGLLGMQKIVGFSESVSLDSLGLGIQNPEIVMRVKFFDGATGEPYTLLSEPYFRGSVESIYRRGAWKHKADEGTPIGSDDRNLAQVSDHWVRQEISVEPMDHDVLFTTYTPFRIAESPADKDHLRRWPRERFRRIQYTYGVNGLRGGLPVNVVPMPRPDYKSLEELASMPLARNGVDPLPLPTLKATAERWMNESGLPVTDRVGRSRALANRLRGPPFEYSLEPQERDSKIDPIEDFVRNNPRGHCEYFATALALMLRSQNIPARVVVGYRGADWNAIGGFYQVRQLNAHAWVEVYLAPGQVPADDMARDPSLQDGAWLILDPTPGEADSMAARSSWTASLRDFSDYMKMMWTSYIVGMTSDRQQESIYQPIVERIGWLVHGTFSPAAWRSTGRRIAAACGADMNIDRAENWLGLHACLLGLALVTLSWRFRKRLRFALGRAGVRRFKPAASQRVAVARPVDFFARFERLLARRGLVRSPAQTPREFAMASAMRLAQLAPPGSASGAMQRIVDAFYRVRYGGHSLDKRALEQVEQALLELERVLSPSAGARLA